VIDYEFNGLPVHILLVHLVVVLVPATALCLLLTAFWPAARRRLGFVTPLLALLALIAVPFTTAAGEWLQARVAATPLVATHAALGPQLLPWVIAMFVVASALWLWHFLEPALPKPARIAAVVILDAAALVAAAGAVVLIVLIGESGSAAVWTGSFL
jgi:hypothetical protein